MTTTATRMPAERPGRPTVSPWPIRPFAFIWARRSFAWGKQRWWLELVTIGFGYFVYEIIQGAAPAHRGLAFANGRRIHDLQVWAHIDLDGPVNRIVNEHLWLALSTGYYYDTLHYLMTPAVLLFVWIWHPALYGRYRSALILASMGGLVVFYALPVAPPRFVVPGITDTLVVHHIFGTVASDGKQRLINDVAAMPSLHVGWAAWCALTIIGVTASRWRYLAWLYPIATTFVVLGTGNHYLLDGAGGVAIVLLGFAVTRAPRELDPPGGGLPGSASRESGSRESGAHERASRESGSHELGSHQLMSRESGSHERASRESGSHELN